MSFQDDRGGNEVGISGGLCSWDLHAVWDGCIIDQGMPGDPYSLARDLLGEVTDRDRATWRASGPIDWANESFTVSISPEVGYWVSTNDGCWYETQKRRLDHGEPERAVLVNGAYIETHTPTVRDRLIKAGVRLGGVLNAALDDQSSVHTLATSDKRSDSLQALPGPGGTSRGAPKPGGDVAGCMADQQLCTAARAGLPFIYRYESDRVLSFLTLSNHWLLVPLPPPVLPSRTFFSRS